MGRKTVTTANTAQVVTDADTPTLPGMTEAANVLAAVQADYSEERDLLNQLLGQAQMAEAFSKFSKTVLVSKLAFVKENKLYQQLSGKRTQDGLGYSGTWAEFCNLLGWTPEHANEAISNLHNFGEEALESMSRMGIGYRELRQFRRLPEDQKTALIEVAKSGDKDSFLELAEDLIAKHAKEKEALSNQMAEIAADKEATERVTKSKEETINRLQREVVRLSKPLTVTPWDTRVAPFQREITERQSVLDAAIAKHLEAIKALDAWMTGEITNAPDYDPEAPVSLPPAIRAVVLHLDDAVSRTATLAAEMQRELRMRFGADIDDARQHVLTEGA
ncbi:hypothetical protein [Leeia aquatica]|uniref:hypothetical protein n=1 Tax=Leeia aquatica TaxID=2725557 RepID=UPI00197ED423|nr:hypothetical protein [Leeia aquatica]